MSERRFFPSAAPRPSTVRARRGSACRLVGVALARSARGGAREGPQAQGALPGAAGAGASHWRGIGVDVIAAVLAVDLAIAVLVTLVAPEALESGLTPDAPECAVQASADEHGGAGRTDGST